MVTVKESDIDPKDIENAQLENDEDLRAFEERKNEPSVPYDKVIEELKSKGKYTIKALK